VREKSGDPSVTDEDARFTFEEWDRRARSGAADTLNLYTDDATPESPLVPRILAVEGGLLRGKDAIGEFFTEGIRRRPTAPVRWYRSGEYLWDGHTLSWEYLRATPDGEQVDIAEYMRLRGPRIAAHRIYWGWFGTEMLITNALEGRL
jgi:hypothetical protein